MSGKEQKKMKGILNSSGNVKVSYNAKAGFIIALPGQNHSYSILNYNRKRKNKIPFDEWTRIIIDNIKKRVWLRVASEDPEKSFNLQYNAVEKLELYKTGYKIKFNTSQNELQEYYERRDI